MKEKNFRIALGMISISMLLLYAIFLYNVIDRKNMEVAKNRKVNIPINVNTNLEEKVSIKHPCYESRY